MSGRVVFEYALLRAVPRLDRGESVNIGVIVYCQGRDYLAAAGHVEAGRLRALEPQIDVDAIADAVESVRRTCAGGTDAGPAGGQSRGERFRWLTAPRSTVVQPGPVHAGLTDDPDAELHRLLDSLVR